MSSRGAFVCDVKGLKVIAHLQREVNHWKSRARRQPTRGHKMNEEVLDEDFDPVSSLSGPLMKKVMADVARFRAQQDGELGFFRDYADGTAGRMLMGPTVSRDLEAERDAHRKRLEADRTGKTTWRHRLEEAHTAVISAGTEYRLREKLVALSAESIAWIEAIDRRNDEKRIEKKMAPLTRVDRFMMWLLRWLGVRPF